MRAFAAFVLYVEMEPNRSHVALSQRLGKSTGTLRRWASRFDWKERALAFDRAFDRQVLNIRLREAAKIGRMQARKAARKTGQLVRQLTSIDPREMSVLEAIALLELSMKIERQALGIKNEWADQEKKSVPTKSSSWLQ